MKIHETGIDRLRAMLESLSKSDGKRTEGSERTQGAAPGTPAAGSDRVDVSGLARDFARLRATIEKTPEIREAAVTAFRDVIASGQYRVDDERLATLLADELFGE